MDQFLSFAQSWQNFYNNERAHFGRGMDGLSPMEFLRKEGYDFPDTIGSFPVMVLDEVALEVQVKFYQMGGNDLLAQYICPDLICHQFEIETWKSDMKRDTD